MVRINGKSAIREVYNASDAVISTSLYETLPGTLVEGLVYGCSPIAFNHRGQADIVMHKSTGYLAEWSDDTKTAAARIAEGIIWAINQNQEEIKLRMFESAKARFDAKVIEEKYIDLFKTLLS